MHIPRNTLKYKRNCDQVLKCSSLSIKIPLPSNVGKKYQSSFHNIPLQGYFSENTS